MRALVLCSILSCATSCVAWSDLKSQWSRGLGLEPGPLVRATRGDIWPMPQEFIKYEQYMSVYPKNFTFEVTGNTCPIITEAIKRYELTLKRMWNKSRKSRKLYIHRPLPDYIEDKLTSLQVNLNGSCDSHPYLHMNEAYALRVNSLSLPGAAELASLSVWGILRGLETFLQLLYLSDDGTQLIIRGALIDDYPRFPHRGLHLDTARHFIPLRVIYTMLNGMAINKFNVFHWHIVDDQSFPYESQVYPELSKQGAYSPQHVYSQTDVANVIEFARLRGIRVIPEFDTPGHTRSWGNAYPELLTPCFNNDNEPDGSLGPIHPLRNFTYEFMTTLIRELVQVFPDEYIHLGGDEVPFDCWQSNPEISQYLKDNGLTMEGLEEKYIKRIVDETAALNVNQIVWQEVFDNGVKLPQTTTVHVWKDWTDYMGEMANVTGTGYNAILSSCWYLDHLSSGGDWQKFYNCDPTSFPGSDASHQRVLGGEACMWSEVADATNVLTRIWPRASAAAEKLWSSAGANDLQSAAARLEEHSCRMNLRGVPAQPPNGPGFCPFQLF